MSVTMASDLLALLEACKDHPHDDTARLVLADWLEEHGRDEAERARASFIRLQCQRAKLIAETRDYAAVTAQPQYCQLKMQEESLRRAHLSSWLGVWQIWIVRPDNEEHWFQRGFLRPWVIGTQWLEEISQDDTVWAWVDGLVVLNPCLKHVERLAASPVLERLNSLHVGPDGWPGASGIDFGPEGARQVASSTHLTRLVSLTLTDAVIGPEGAKALAESPAMRRLTFLDLSGFDCTPGNYIGDEGVRALAESANMARLIHLNLMENGITVAGARALADSPHLSQLTYLNLSGNFIGPEGAELVRRRFGAACIF